MKERTNHMEYMEGMEVIDSTLLDEVISAMDAYDYDKYTDKDVENALSHDILTTEDFAALLSPAALNHLEEMAQRAQIETRKHFGNSVSMFTPLYIANYCENYCIYCGFNCYNKIRRAKLSEEEIKKEMQEIAKTGLQEILILTGESRKMSVIIPYRHTQAPALKAPYIQAVQFCFPLELYPNFVQALHRTKVISPLMTTHFVHI